MGAEGMVSFTAIVVLLFPLAAAMVSESHRDSQQLPLGNLSNLEGMMDEETVEASCADGGTEFNHSVEALQDFKSDDLRDKNHVSVGDKRIRSRDAVPIRRKLAEVNCEPHCTGKTHNSPVFPKEHDHYSLEKDIEPIPFTVSKAETDGGGIDTTTIIIVVVSTATLTFLLATLLFCWYTRTYGGVQIDEKPLLSLSRNECSNGSSQKPPYTLQKSAKDFGNTGDILLSTKSDLLKTDSTVDSSVSLGIPLEPPPGNLSASGTAPLKPPPGRPELALKTPPGRKDLSLRCPSVNTSALPNRPPTSAAPPVRAPSAKRAPSARRPPSAAPPPPPPSGRAPPPPPPLKKGPTPPPPPAGGRAPPRPPGVGFKPSHPSFGPGEPDGDDSNKAKLKPFFWDKVMANPDQAMVWHQIRAGSFQFNEETIENLFGYSATDKTKGNHKKSSSQDSSSNFVQIIESKKAQNLSILLKALNVTTNEVCDALKEGNELPVELIQTLLKMAPTGEEELKLRLYNGDISRLGTAERFLKKLVEIPFAFKRLESLLFMCTLQEEEDIIKESFQTLEAACKELKKSRLFLKLLEAVLKTGNRMNDGTFRGSAQAFKLDTLLKLSDVKGVDGKITLLHFVVLEIIRAEGMRAAKTADEGKSFSGFKSDEFLEESANSSQDSDEYYRTLGLQAVSSLSSELEDVKKAAVLDADGLTGTVSKFGNALTKAREFLSTDLKNIKEKDNDGDDDDDDEFAMVLSNFVQDAEKDVMWMLEEEKRIMALVKNTADYFHGQAGKDEGLRLFVIIRDFLIILDKVCKEIKMNPPVRPSKKTEEKDAGSSSKPTEKKDGSSSESTETKDDSKPRTSQSEDVLEPSTTQTEGVSKPRMTQTKDVSEPRMTQTEDVSEPRMTDTEDILEPWMRHREDVFEPRMTHTQDVSEPTTTRTEDVSEHRMVQTQDVSELEMTHVEDVSEPKMTQTKYVSQSRTQEADDVQHETRKVDDLQDSWETEDPLNETKEIEDLQHETLEAKVLKHETREIGNPRTEIQGVYNLVHERQETNNPQHQMWETEGSNTQEPDYSQHITKEDDSQPRTDEDDGLQVKTGEHDDSHPKTEDDDGGLQLQTKEDDDLKHATEEINDSHHKTQRKDVESMSERSSEPQQFPFRVPHERLIPAIAMRRVDTFSSDSSSDED